MSKFCHLILNSIITKAFVSVSKASVSILRLLSWNSDWIKSNQKISHKFFSAKDCISLSNLNPTSLIYSSFPFLFRYICIKLSSKTIKKHTKIKCVLLVLHNSKSEGRRYHRKRILDWFLLTEMRLREVLLFLSSEREKRLVRPSQSNDKNFFLQLVGDSHSIAFVIYIQYTENRRIASPYFLSRMSAIPLIL